MIAILPRRRAILLALGVVGSYVWRAYENGKGRPLELDGTHHEVSGERPSATRSGRRFAQSDRESPR